MAKPRRSASPARWALQDAKNRFSEVVEAAVRGEPQVVTRRGVETAVILSHEEYTRMTARGAGTRPSFSEYLVDGSAIERGEPFERIELRPRRRE